MEIRIISIKHKCPARGRLLLLWLWCCNNSSGRGEAEPVSWDRANIHILPPLASTVHIHTADTQDWGAIIELFVQASKSHRNPWKSHFLPQKVP